MKAFPLLMTASDWSGIQYVIADKGYDSYDVRTLIKSANMISIIPRRKGAICLGVYDQVRYKTRHAIERFFAHIKENKRMALRFNKLDATFFSFFALACLCVFKFLC